MAFASLSSAGGLVRPCRNSLSIGRRSANLAAMLTKYIRSAMRHAHYEIMENGRFWGDIPPCKGCWAEGATLEECRENLRGALECWILLGVEHGDACQ